MTGTCCLTPTEGSCPLSCPRLAIECISSRSRRPQHPYYKGQFTITHTSPPVFGPVWPPSSDPQILPISTPTETISYKNIECVVGTIYPKKRRQRVTQLISPIVPRFAFCDRASNLHRYGGDRGFRHLFGCSDSSDTTGFLAVPGYRPGANAGGGSRLPVNSRVQGRKAKAEWVRK